MQPGFARTSLLLFGISVVLLIALTVFESAFAGMSQGMERVITFLLLVLPAGIGSVLGILSLTRREGQAWLAITGIIMNALFSLFHLFIVLFAG